MCQTSKPSMTLYCFISASTLFVQYDDVLTPVNLFESIFISYTVNWPVTNGEYRMYGKRVQFARNQLTLAFAHRLGVH